jgi:hypothetical protein
MIKYYGCLFLLLIAGCRKGDKVPAYLEVNSVAVTPVAGVSGTTTSRVTDIWVYDGDVLLGTWEVPARIPILREGPSRIQITPAVKRNGMYDDRVRYPFYTWWSGTVDLMKEETTVLDPQVSYIPQTDIWVEAFESAGVQLSVAQGSNVELQRFNPQQHPDIVLPGGSPAGGFVLPGPDSHVRFITTENFNPTGGPMFLELDYSTNVVLTVGISYSAGGTINAEPYVYLTPTLQGDVMQPAWNKVYIDLSPVFNLSIAQRNFYFEASGPANGTGRIYLDNIRLVRTAS